MYRDDMSSSIVKLLFLNLMDVKGLDFSQPYYNESTLESMKINGKLFHMVSDFSLVDKNRIATLYANRDMADDFQIPDLVKTVEAGTWTFEKFATYVKQVASDISGDGKMVYTDDRFGVTIGSADEVVNFWSSMGAKTITKDGDNYVFSYNSEFSSNCANLIKSIFTNPNYYFASTKADNYDGSRDVNLAGRTLFELATLSGLPNIAQNSTFRFTVLPLPKYDESQQSYYSNNNNRFCGTFGIPVCAADPEFSAFMIEALSWKSTETTLTTYIDIYCKARNSYDYDCQKMLDILFKSLSYDFGFMNDSALNSLPKSAISNCLRSESMSMTVVFATNKKAQNTLLTKILDSINAK